MLGLAVVSNRRNFFELSHIHWGFLPQIEVQPIFIIDNVDKESKQIKRTSLLYFEIKVRFQELV